MIVLIVLLGLLNSGGPPARGEEFSSSYSSDSSTSSTTQKLDLSSPALFRSIDSAIPNNVVVPEIMRAQVRAMWVRSATFRRQCARIARALDGRVKITVSGQPLANMRAVSQIRRTPDGMWQAMVRVFFSDELVELIAHEFEHILEYIEGIDLPELQHQGLDGVMTEHGHFETARAVAAGKRVAAECAAYGKQSS